MSCVMDLTWNIGHSVITCRYLQTLLRIFFKIPYAWSRVLEELTVTQLVKKLPALLWNLKFHYCVHKSLLPSRVNNLFTLSECYCEVSHALPPISCRTGFSLT